ncbi:MAG: hypothetical protein MUE35_10945, partial [Hydrogenophaga sp.]|nr:hypothetical protein [Hydrogenophaga sp.]
MIATFSIGSLDADRFGWKGFFHCAKASGISQSLLTYSRFVIALAVSLDFFAASSCLTCAAI